MSKKIKSGFPAFTNGRAFDCIGTFTYNPEVIKPVNVILHGFNSQGLIVDDHAFISHGAFLIIIPYLAKLTAIIYPLSKMNILPHATLVHPGFRFKTDFKPGYSNQQKIGLRNLRWSYRIVRYKFYLNGFVNFSNQCRLQFPDGLLLVWCFEC